MPHLVEDMVFVFWNYFVQCLAKLKGVCLVFTAPAAYLSTALHAAHSIVHRSALLSCMPSWMSGCAIYVY